MAMTWKKGNKNRGCWGDPIPVTMDGWMMENEEWMMDDGPDNG